MAAPHRSSQALRVLAGTNRPDRDAPTGGLEHEPIALLPPHPTWMLDEWAREEWYRLGPILLRVGLLTTANLPAFAHLCSLHGDMATGYQNRNPPKAATIMAYRSLIVEFGLTPAAASKVKAPDPVQQGNKFRANGRPAGA